MYGHLTEQIEFLNVISPTNTGCATRELNLVCFVWGVVNHHITRTGRRSRTVIIVLMFMLALDDEVAMYSSSTHSWLREGSNKSLLKVT